MSSEPLKKFPKSAPERQQCLQVSAEAACQYTRSAWEVWSSVGKKAIRHGGCSVRGGVRESMVKRVSASHVCHHKGVWGVDDVSSLGKGLSLPIPGAMRGV